MPILSLTKILLEYPAIIIITPVVTLIPNPYPNANPEPYKKLFYNTLPL